MINVYVGWLWRGQLNYFSFSRSRVCIYWARPSVVSSDFTLAWASSWELVQALRLRKITSSAQSARWLSLTQQWTSIYSLTFAKRWFRARIISNFANAPFSNDTDKAREKSPFNVVFNLWLIKLELFYTNPNHWKRTFLYDKRECCSALFEYRAFWKMIIFKFRIDGWLRNGGWYLCFIVCTGLLAGLVGDDDWLGLCSCALGLVSVVTFGDWLFTEVSL
jgi:hypothetical protein